MLARAQAVAHELAALPSSTYRSVKAQLRGPDLEAMRAGVEDDPLAQGWLGDETADAARAALE